MYKLFVNINQSMEIYACTIEIEQNGNVQRTIIEAPRIMLEQQFINLVEQAANSHNPIRVKISREVPIYNNFNNEWTKIENNIVFENNAYIKHRENNAGV